MTASPLTGGRTPSALRRIANEVAKFGIVGISGVVIQLISFGILLDFMQTVRANIVATLIAIATNYVGYRYWVYRDADKKTRSREISLFLVFSAIGLVIQNGVLYVLTYGLDFHTKLESLVCSVIGIGVATVFRFWAYRTWVFRVVPQAEEALDAAEQILAAEHVKRSASVTHRR
ncbi:GtrA family protein [Streptacidiphilus melanogenes]|uniref:GtrA family protein n=1 Tax=Streptacidiphilus melanogenes TaxID=411235 RepID=UPI0005A6D222|nr:GtrA family protein [Streptacidiphilus melanogenes]